MNKRIIVLLFTLLFSTAKINSMERTTLNFIGNGIVKLLKNIAYLYVNDKQNKLYNDRTVVHDAMKILSALIVAGVVAEKLGKYFFPHLFPNRVRREENGIPDELQFIVEDWEIDEIPIDNRYYGN